MQYAIMKYIFVDFNNVLLLHDLRQNVNNFRTFLDKLCAVLESHYYKN